MSMSSRYVTSLHALVVLACFGSEGPVCSAVIAASLHTNPVVVRRLMGALEAHGLVVASAGRTGGFSLARAAENISLADVWHAVAPALAGSVRSSSSRPECPVSQKIETAIAGPFAEAQKALVAALSHTSLASLAHGIGCGE